MKLGVVVKMKLRNFASLLALTVFITACGGGSSGSLIPTAPETPVGGEPPSQPDPVDPPPIEPEDPPVIAPTNRAPEVQNDSVTIQEDGIVGGLDVLANDTDPEGDPLQIVGVSADPSAGSVSITLLNRVRFEPAENLNGVVSILVTISDGRNEVTSNLDVVISPVDDQVFLRDDYFSISEGSSNNVLAVLANDQADNGGVIELLAAQSFSGTVSISGDTLTYTPLPDFVGTELISYEIVDVDGDVLSAMATVEVVAEVGEEFRLEWQNPDQRIDGVDLQESEIASYLIELRNIETEEYSQVQVDSAEASVEGDNIAYVLTDLSPGFFEFSLKVVDVMGNIGESFSTDVVQIGG